MAARPVTYEVEDTAVDWAQASATLVELQGNSARVNGAGAALNGNDLYLVSAGVYVLSGSLTNGQVIVDSQTKGTVRIILNGVELHNERSAAIYVKKADKTIITLQAGTQNLVSDGKSYADTTSADAPKAAIYSMDDLTINGTGKLTVRGNFDVGIMSKDDLRITGGELLVYADDDGLVGRDRVIIKEGSLTVEAGGDGIKTTNDSDPEKGYVAIEGGSIRLTTGNDGIQAETAIQISGGDYVITTNGGNTKGVVKTESFGPQGRPARPGATGQAPVAPPSTTTAATTDAPSAKGLKALDITISSGTFQIDSADDAIHSNNSISITSGKITILSGDDGIHADTSLLIAGGTIAIDKSYEGLESKLITISGGVANVVATDDGINVVGGADGSSVNGRPGQNRFSAGTGTLQVQGGTITVEAAGDGVDTNGSIYMSAGTLRVNGPTGNMNGSLDYDGLFEITGGTVIAAGSTGMVQAPSDKSPQYSVGMTFSSRPKAGTKVSLRDSQGKELLSMELKQAYPSVVFSTPDLKKGESYAIYNGEQRVVSFTLESQVTWLNESGVTAAPRSGPPGRP